MREIELLDENKVTSINNKEFILLGSKKMISGKDIHPYVFDKIKGKINSNVPGFWGTLGMENNSPITWKGSLFVSNEGNTDQAKGETLGEINLIKSVADDLYITEDRLTERFISFDNVTFTDMQRDYFSVNQIPKLRLTLMLGQDEGAIVFYLHGSKNKDDAEEVIEYIQPESTGNLKTSERDRLTYCFPILFSNQLVEVLGSNGRMKLGEEHANQFVIKILTYKRDNRKIDKLIEAKGTHLKDTDHQLVKYNFETGAFDEVSEIDKDLKTLLLIHGTLSNTIEAFAGLMEMNDQQVSWLDQQKSFYPQIIGFNHPTIIENAEDNVAALINILGPNFQFKHEVDIITHSRGGLVGKYIAKNIQQVPIGKGALVACANGVGYFTAGNHLAKLLSILKELSKMGGNATLATIFGIAQFSAKKILNMPGCKQMTPGDPSLTDIDTAPLLNNTKFIPVVGNFNSSLVQGSGFGRLVKKWMEIGLDNVIKLFLGTEHDWVVGTKEQFILNPISYYAPNYTPNGYKNLMVAATHSDYFHRAICPMVLPDISSFFGTDVPSLNPTLPLRTLKKGESITVAISSELLLAPTRLQLETDCTYHFKVASGQTWTDGSIQTDANGYFRWYLWIFNYFKRNRDAAWFELIGTIDNGVTSFIIGEDLIYKNTITGPLCCFANDAKSRYGNNKGEVLLEITKLE